jgi:hypothetical protein
METRTQLQCSHFGANGNEAASNLWKNRHVASLETMNVLLCWRSHWVPDGANDERTFPGKHLSFLSGAFRARLAATVTSQSDSLLVISSGHLS